MQVNQQVIRILFTIIGMFLITLSSAYGQVVSPLQSGHYSPAVANIRDFATPPPGLFVLWYNVYASSDKYIDRDGNEFNSIRLDQIHPNLPNIDVDLKMDGFASIPSLFWASHYKLLGGARYMAGIAANYISADASLVTERSGIIIDTTYTRKVEGKNSGFSDLLVVPLGLSWGLDKFDFTFLYGLAIPTGKYETGSSENLGLGFWTHQFQGFGYFYPVPDKSTAIMMGLTFEFNGKIKDADVKPGNRFYLEWGISQYLSEQFELGIQGGHNWQISDDTGDDVYWDPGYHDRKSTIAFNAGYWPWKQRLSLTLKYGFDFGVRQRFKNNSWMLNILFIPNVLMGE
jgi:hypothetical protein